MCLRASFTLENAVIIPIFVCVIAAFIMVTFDMHDSVVVRSVDVQVAMKMEQELETDTKEVLYTAVSNINAKCILRQDNSQEAIAKRICESELITDNRQPDFIRIVSAGLKLLDE